MTRTSEALARVLSPPEEPRADHKALYNGFGDALATAFELVATPVLFLFFGRWLDGRFDTRPILTVVLTTLALFSVVAKAYYGYKAAMDREEEDKPWRR